MSVFDQDEEGEEALRQRAAESGVDFNNAAPGFFDNTGYGIGMGIARGGAKVGRAIALAGAAPLAAYERAYGYQPGTITDPYFETVVKPADEAVEFFTPNANEVGTAGRLLGTLAEIVAPLAAGAGNPALLIGSTALNTPTDLVKQGVDSTTAVGVGLVDATAIGIGFRLPFLGKTFAQKAGTGAVTNVGLGFGATAIDREILDARGYDELAKLYNPLDIEARTLDLLTGIAFGGVAQLRERGGPGGADARAQAAALAARDAQAREAALAALNALHYQFETAPGRPANEAALVAHQRALAESLVQLQEGRPVDVGNTGVTDANFIPREAVPLDPEVRTVLDQLGIRDTDPALVETLTNARAEVLGDADRAIETRFIEKLRSDPDAAAREYATLPDAGGGKILNTDTARELSPDYLADRTKSAAVHEPASAFIKELYRRKLAEEPGPGEQPLVVFSAGGTGAGKSTGLKLTGADSVAQIIYDTNMNTLASSVRRIEQALAAGKSVEIQYTYRDPVEALTAGALPRAMRQESTYGSGRTVPLSEHAKTHIGAAQVVRTIAEKYKDNPRVELSVIDNSKGKGKAAVVDLQVVPEVDPDQNTLVRRLNDALETEYAAGRISEAIYRGFKGEAEATGTGANTGTLQPEGARGPAGAGDRGRAESTRPATDQLEASNATDTGTTGEAGTAVPDAGPQPVPDGGGLRGGGRGSASSEASSGPVRPQPLEGLPATVEVEGRGLVTFGPHAPAHEAAAAYAQQSGIPYTPNPRYAPVDVARATRIADTFEAMPHAPTDPAVAASYAALIEETLAQYQAIKATGLKIEAIESTMADPYEATPRLAILDVVENNHLWFFPTEGGFGSDGAFAAEGHPLLALTNEYIGGRQLTANDVFRIVHDYFGHIKDGVGFRAGGEENAWRSHVGMYSPAARGAMTTETRGQNSWVNYGPFGEANRSASGGKTKYADQKAGLLPTEFWAFDDAPPPSAKPEQWLTLHSRQPEQNLPPEIAFPETPVADRVFRGVTSEEFASIQRTGGIRSTGDASHSSEGTSFTDDPQVARSYATYGRDNPAKTGKPVYVVEVRAGDDIQLDRRDYYYKSTFDADGARTAIPADRITRTWRMNPDGSTELVAPRPPRAAPDSPTVSIDDIGDVLATPRPAESAKPAADQQVDPDVIAARQLIEQSDIPIPTGDIDADGVPIVASARELMAAADAEVARAASEGKGYEAAVTCLLSFGDGP